MTRAAAWLRQLDSDALSGRARTRRVIAVPLATFLGVLAGGGLGYLAGVYLGLLPIFNGNYGVIVFPYVGTAIGVPAGGALGIGLALRKRR